MRPALKLLPKMARNDLNPYKKSDQKVTICTPCEIKGAVCGKRAHCASESRRSTDVFFGLNAEESCKVCFGFT